MNDKDRALIKEIGKICADCKFFTVTGQKDSGIKCPDNVTPWFYDVGDCDHPEPKLGGALVHWTAHPCWSGCFQWNRK